MDLLLYSKLQEYLDKYDQELIYNNYYKVINHNN
jgi:hypothetical protein